MLGRGKSPLRGTPLAFTDAGVVVVAGVTVIGAWVARPVPGIPALFVGVVALLALVRRWPVVVVIALAVLASDRSAQAWSGTDPRPPRPVAATVTLLGDPEPFGGGVSVVARLDGRHVELRAFGGSARRLSRRAAGERVAITGRLAPVPVASRRRLAERHVAGRVDVTAVGGWSAGSPAARAANRVRRLLTRGATSMSPGERALYTGLVIGDDRDEPRDLVDAFRASGLSHLTAVSGENVAFVLMAAAPVLRRLGLRGRLVATLGLVAWFALLTRFEPSVLRAAMMATLATAAWFLARPASPLRLLGLAVTALVIVDPLLVWSVGFWLSVGATFGIALFAAPIAARLPGPRALAAAIGVTLAAQVGVAPIQIAVFGPPSVAAVPANLLAVPVAGPVMVWGLTGGLVAGLLPPAVRGVVQLPARGALRWLAVVARVGAAAPSTPAWWVPLAAVVVVAGWCRARR
jgi:competence protein ComEC